MRCPECQTINEADAAACPKCGLLMLNLLPKRRADDLAMQRRRSNDETGVPCRFCGGSIPADAIRCRHCSEIVNDDFYRERAKRIRNRINYTSWIAYLFGLASLLVLRPVGIFSIGAGLLLSIVYYAIPVEPPATGGKKTKTSEFLRKQFKMERVQFPIPLFKHKKLVFVGTPLIATLVGYSANLFLLQQPMNDVLRQSSAFTGMQVSTHYKYWVVPGVVDYDLEGISIHQTPIDVHTALLEFAKKVKDKRYSRIDISYRGITKFSIDGAEFQKVGQEYAKQNFDYVLYEFPKQIKTADGSTIRSNASNRDALLQFHRRWYGNDSMTRAVATGM